MHSLDFELFPDQFTQVLPLDDDVAPVGFGAFVFHAEVFTESAVRFHFEKGDLAFVVLLVVKEAISRDSFPGDAFYFFDFDDRVFPGGLSVVPVVVVTGRNVEMKNFHRGSYDAISLLAIRAEADTVPLFHKSF